jgi:hypothetical protein
MNTRNEWEMRHSPVPNPPASPAEIDAYKREQELHRQISDLKQQLAQARVDAARFAKLKERASLDAPCDSLSGTWFIGHIDAFSRWGGNAYDHQTFEGAVDAMKS